MKTEYKPFEVKKEYINKSDIVDDNGNIDIRQLAIQINRLLHFQNDIFNQINELNNNIYYIERILNNTIDSVNRIKIKRKQNKKSTQNKTKKIIIK